MFVAKSFEMAIEIYIVLVVSRTERTCALGSLEWCCSVVIFCILLAKDGKKLADGPHGVFVFR